MNTSYRYIWILLGITLLAGTAGAAGAAPEKVDFALHRIGTYRSEACGVGDFNNDGKLDIVALPLLYLAPEFAPMTICEMQGEVDDQGKGYRWVFMSAPLDVDGDGWLDVITCSWFGKNAEWLRNPGPAGGLWPRTLIEENGNYECGDLWDVDGDGKPMEVIPSVTGTCWYEPAQTPRGERTMIKHLISEKTMAWGSGCGDVNGDGRPDVLRPEAWFEAPADPRKETWIEHPWTIGGKEENKADHTPQILVYDVNADGLADIVTSIAHDYGIFWYEQVRQDAGATWKRHLIDNTWSQAHSLALADMDNDGDLDLVTGKRFMAHNGGDPGEYEPLGVYWYELTRHPGPVWTQHKISYDENIGSGLNIAACDLDADGDMDVVVTGKWGGPAWFENKLK